MFDPSYQRRRGELQSLGEILHAALKVADPDYYRPERPFQHARKSRKSRQKDNGKLQGVQLELFAPKINPALAMPDEDYPSELETPDCTAITSENPITDADVPF